MIYGEGPYIWRFRFVALYWTLREHPLPCIYRRTNLNGNIVIDISHSMYLLCDAKPASVVLFGKFKHAPEPRGMFGPSPW